MEKADSPPRLLEARAVAGRVVFGAIVEGSRQASRVGGKSVAGLLKERSCRKASRAGQQDQISWCQGLP